MSQIPSGISQTAYLNWLSQTQAAQQYNSQQGTNQLVSQAQTGYDQYREDANNRYLDILQGLGVTRDRVMNDVNQFGTGRQNQINSDFDSNLKSSLGDSVAGGFYSPGARASIRNQNSTQRQLALGNAQDQTLQNKANYDTSLSNNIFGFMERRQDIPPNYNYLNQLGQQLGQNGGFGGAIGLNAAPTSPMGSGQVGAPVGSRPSIMPQYTGRMAMPTLQAAPAQKSNASPQMLTPSQQQSFDLLSQGYQSMGNNNYVRPGSGIGGNGLLPSQYLSGPPLPGTRMLTGQPIYSQGFQAQQTNYLGGLQGGGYQQPPYQGQYGVGQQQGGAQRFPSPGQQLAPNAFNQNMNFFAPGRNAYMAPAAYQQQSPFGEMQYDGGKSPYVMDGILGGQNPNAGFPMNYLAAMTRPQY